MVTRGFGGRQPPRDVANRLPPGQFVTEDFPVLSAGPNPRISMDDWKFTLKVRAKPVAEWSWADFNALPQTRMTRDIHCVTAWSKFDTAWEGVLVDDILAEAGIEPATAFMLAHSYDGYTTNVPTADLTGGKAMVAVKYDGKPITADHGGPARLLVPHLYFWKSAKWVTGLQFTDTDTPASGNCAAITFMAIRGASNATPMTEAGAAAFPAHRPARWQPTTITAIERLTPRVMGFRFRPSQPFAYAAGQHVDIRLTAPDGYSAQRSYSIASAPEAGDEIELAIERLDDGEVSPFFHEVAAVGDEIELKGPLGGHFVWDEATPGPIALIGGGSGVVPLASMIRHRAASRSTRPVSLIYSSREWDEVIFRDELLALDDWRDGFDLTLTLTRDKPRRDKDFGRRIDAEMISGVLSRLPRPPALAYVCGANLFVTAAADALIAAGTAPERVRTERYGV